jgi:Flp pilus assembly protein TadG
LRLASRIRRLADARGQSLVEFSLVAFLSVMLLLGAFEMCRMVLVYTTIANAARAGTRYAIVHGSDASTTTAQIQAVVTAYLRAAPMAASNANFNSTPSYPDSCTDPGCRVTLTVTYQYDPWVGYFPWGTINLGSTAQGVITY